MTKDRYVVTVMDDGEYLPWASVETDLDEIFIASTYKNPAFIIKHRVVDFDQVNVWPKHPLPEAIQVDGEFYFVLNGVY